jgi:hypothetical protein
LVFFLTSAGRSDFGALLRLAGGAATWTEGSKTVSGTRRLAGTLLLAVDSPVATSRFRFLCDFFSYSSGLEVEGAGAPLLEAAKMSSISERGMVEDVVEDKGKTDGKKICLAEHNIVGGDAGV